jgi:hypothetical protein
VVTGVKGALLEPRPAQLTLEQVVICGVQPVCCVQRPCPLGGWVALYWKNEVRSAAKGPFYTGAARWWSRETSGRTGADKLPITQQPVNFFSQGGPGLPRTHWLFLCCMSE